MTSGQPSAFFFLGAGALVIAAWGESRLPGSNARGIHPRSSIGLVVAAFLLVQVGGTNVQSLWQSLQLKQLGERHPIVERLDSPALAQLLMAGNSGFKEYATYINSGLALLRKYSSHDESIVVFDFTNMFSFALQRRSPRGDALWCHANVIIDVARYPPAERVFSQVKIVMIPKLPIDRDTRNLLLSMYGEAIRARFEVVAENAWWTLLRRRA